jgi:hypothetical protein
MPRRRETDTVMDRPSGTQEPADSAATSGQAIGAPQTDPTTGVRQVEPTTEQIAQRAYELYQARGGTEGQDIEDWLEAERQLKRGPQAATE